MQFSFASHGTNRCLCALDQVCEHKGHKADTADPVAINLPGDIVQVRSMLDSHPFVQEVCLTKGKSPTILLYTDQQLADMRRFCCQGNDGTPQSVLGVDRTSNFGPCYVTVLVYTCRAVVRNDTGTHPTFVGPMLLHWDEQYATYVKFFSAVRALLDDIVSSTEVRISPSAVIGSDAENGLTKALCNVFRESTHLFCVKHLRDNVVEHMRDKCGIQQSVVDQLVAEIFDDSGLINADDSAAYSRAAESLALECDTISSTLGQHFRCQVEPTLRTFVFKPGQQHPWVGRHRRNNTTESMKQLLNSVNPHPQHLPELIDQLYEVVSVQMTDLHQSLYAQGSYTLVASFNRFSQPHVTWQAKSPQV